MSEAMIIRDPGILGGTPCIAGTRLNVYAVAARYAGGETPEEIIDGYPDLTPEHVLAAVRYADSNPFIEHPDARPWRKKARTDAV